VTVWWGPHWFIWISLERASSDFGRTNVGLSFVPSGKPLKCDHTLVTALVYQGRMSLQLTAMSTGCLITTPGAPAQLDACID